MKKLIAMLVALPLAGAALAVGSRVWPRLPDGTLPDSEVSTNVVLDIDTGRLRVFSLKLDVDSCVSNEVLVAVGGDADSDGDLSIDETAFVFGCECGERYFVNCISGNVETNLPDTVCVGWRNFDPVWNLAKVVKRGTGDIGEVVTEIIENKQFCVRLR